MESKAKLFGHAIHPILIVFPLGLLVIALVFDVLYFLTGEMTFAVVSFWNILAGLLSGALAAVFGFIDWQALPDNTRAKAIGRWHGLGNALVLLLFGASWLIRLNAPEFMPGLLAFLLVLAGGVVGLVSGWLGGELVERLGVGVDEGAHLNAPSSLSNEPASAHYKAEEPVQERAVGR
jgi:uncharacterized membrane protein